MKLRRSLLLILLIGTALAGIAQAGDRMQVGRVNFSPNGQQVLVVVEGVQDGSGFPYAALHLLDTGTGREWRASSQSQNTATTPAQLTAELLRQYRSTLQKAGVTGSGKQVPRNAVPRYQASSPKVAPTWNEGVGAGETQQQSVQLWTNAVPISLQVLSAQTPCKGAALALLPAGQPPARFILSVNGQQVATSAVPCAARYALERVDVQGNRALLTLRAYTPGFEGPNAEPYFVATTLR